MSVWARIRETGALRGRKSVNRGRTNQFTTSRRMTVFARRRRPEFTESLVAHRGLERLHWADSAPPRVASGRTGIRAVAAVPLRAPNRPHRPASIETLADHLEGRKGSFAASRRSAGLCRAEENAALVRAAFLTSRTAEHQAVTRDGLARGAISGACEASETGEHHRPGRRLGYGAEALLRSPRRRLPSSG